MIAEPMTDAELAALVAAPASASPYWVHRLAARDAAHLALVAARDAEVARLREALARWQHYGCPDCSGDCGSANPPVNCCIMQETRAALAEPRA